MMHLFIVLLDMLGIKKDNKYLTKEEIKAYVKQAEIRPPKDIKEPIYSFVKFLEKHPNYFHLTEKWIGRGNTMYTLRDSFNKVSYKFSYDHSFGYYMTPRLHLIELPYSLKLSGDEENYVGIAVKGWLDTRKLKIKGYKDKRREQRQQKVRDKLTLMYTEE